MTIKLLEKPGEGLGFYGAWGLGLMSCEQNLCGLNFLLRPKEEASSFLIGLLRCGRCWVLKTVTNIKNGIRLFYYNMAGYTLLETSSLILFFFTP